MESLTGLLAAIDAILASPGVGSDFSITESLTTGLLSIVDQLMGFIANYNILEAIAALGILG